jgi:hypothetical protein
MEQKTSITYEEFKTPSMHQICTKFCEFQMLSRRPIYNIYLYVVLKLFLLELHHQCMVHSLCYLLQVVAEIEFCNFMDTCRLCWFWSPRLSSTAALVMHPEPWSVFEMPDFWSSHTLFFDDKVVHARMHCGWQLGFIQAWFMSNTWIEFTYDFHSQVLVGWGP